MGSSGSERPAGPALTLVLNGSNSAVSPVNISDCDLIINLVLSPASLITKVILHELLISYVSKLVHTHGEALLGIAVVLLDFPEIGHEDSSAIGILCALVLPAVLSLEGLEVIMGSGVEPNEQDGGGRQQSHEEFIHDTNYNQNLMVKLYVWRVSGYYDMDHSNQVFTGQQVGTGEELQRLLHVVDLGVEVGLRPEPRALDFQEHGLGFLVHRLLLYLELLQPLKQHVPGDNILGWTDVVARHLRAKFIGFDTVVVKVPEVEDYVVEVLVFFLHLLVMRPALICGSTPQEISHGLEDFVHSPQMFILEVAVVEFEEPVVLLLLFGGPVSNTHTRLQRLPRPAFLASLRGLFEFLDRKLSFHIEFVLFRVDRQERIILHLHELHLDCQVLAVHLYQLQTIALGFQGTALSIHTPSTLPDLSTWPLALISTHQIYQPILVSTSSHTVCNPFQTSVSLLSSYQFALYIPEQKRSITDGAIKSAVEFKRKH